MTAVRRLLPLLLAAIVLLTGAFAVFVDHAPPTTWSVPVQVGPLVGDELVWSMRRAPAEVRLEVGPRDQTHTVRIVDRWHPDPMPGRVTERTRVLAAPEVSEAAVTAITDAVLAQEASWTRPPAFVQPLGTRAGPEQVREAIVLQAVVVVWLAGLVATAPAWAGGVPWTAWALLALMLGARIAVTEGLGLHGIWHSNQHGLDRVTDVVRGTPPGRATLGLLHGYGYYVVFQPLYALFGGAVDVLRLATMVATAGLVAAFLWLRALWGSDRVALLGVALLSASPVVLRMGATESMYVPAMLWTVAALWLFELHLRTDQGRWLLLGLGAALVGVQTRAELMALLPGWLVLSMVLRKPAWLRTAWRRPVVWVGVLGAAVLFVPRLLEVLATPPPSDLRRASLDPFADPRLLVLDLVASLGVLALPGVRQGVTAGWRTLRLPGSAWTGLLVMVVVLTGLYAWAVLPYGGPLLRTWQIHAAFDPGLEAPWVGVLVATGAVVGARRDPGVVAWLVVAWAGAMWLYLPQYDCLSTFVRTSLSTWPLLAALGAVGLDALVVRWRGLGVVGVVGLLVGGTMWGSAFMTHRFPKQVQADLLDVVRATVPPGDVVVWLSETDVPAGAREQGFQVSRAHLDDWLGPAWTVRPLKDWLADALPAGRDVWFVRTADCHRVLLDAHGHRALAGSKVVAWHYLDTSDITTAPRVVVEGLPQDWIDPSCVAALAAARPVLELTLDPAVAGSIYESMVGAPARVGLYRLPRRDSP